MSVLCELCQKRHTFMKRDICITNNCKRVLHMWKETYNRVSRVMCYVWAVRTMSKEICITNKCKRVLHMWKETYDWVNRVLFCVYVVRIISNETHLWKEAYVLHTIVKRVLHKRDICITKETYVLQTIVKRVLHIWKETYDRVNRVMYCVWALQNMSKETYIHEKRPIKETCKRVLHMCKETYKRANRVRYWERWGAGVEYHFQEI